MTEPLLFILGALCFALSAIIWGTLRTYTLRGARQVANGSAMILSLAGIGFCLLASGVAIR